MKFKFNIRGLCIAAGIILSIAAYMMTGPGTDLLQKQYNTGSSGGDGYGDTVIISELGKGNKDYAAGTGGTQGSGGSGKAAAVGSESDVNDGTASDYGYGSDGSGLSDRQREEVTELVEKLLTEYTASDIISRKAEELIAEGTAGEQASEGADEAGMSGEKTAEMPGVSDAPDASVGELVSAEIRSVNESIAAAEAAGLVNINTADAEKLMTLAGIGEARACSIISYREEHGPFRAIEDIMKVSGIKEAAFAKIKEHICV